MCLYPSIIENPKYAKSNEKRKGIKDYRLRWIQIPCGYCEECRRAKANEWRVRLMEEIKSNPKNIIFATLTFSEESLKSWNMTKKSQTKHLKKQSVYSESDGGKKQGTTKALADHRART